LPPNQPKLPKMVHYVFQVLPPTRNHDIFSQICFVFLTPWRHDAIFWWGYVGVLLDWQVLMLQLRTRAINTSILIWVCIFLGWPTSSKAGKFGFGETDPRNRPSKQTTKQTAHFCLSIWGERCETDPRNIPRNRPAKQAPEANFPSRTPHFETHPYRLRVLCTMLTSPAFNVPIDWKWKGIQIQKHVRPPRLKGSIPWILLAGWSGIRILIYILVTNGERQLLAISFADSHR